PAVVEVGAVGQLGADLGATNVALRTHAHLGGEVAVLTLARRERARGCVVLLLRTLVADAGQQVRGPAAAFGQEVAAQVQRNAVLAPVQVLVRFLVRVLVVQLGIQRPRRRDELAHAKRAERRIARVAVAVLDVHADATGQVPAVVELLGGGGVREGKARQQGGAQHADLHYITPRSARNESGDGGEHGGRPPGHPTLPVAAQ